MFHVKHLFSFIQNLVSIFVSENKILWIFKEKKSIKKNVSRETFFKLFHIFCL